MDRINKIWPAWHTVELIGKGAYGEVYKVKRELQGETFYSAVKVIKIPGNEQDVRDMAEEGHTSQSIRYYYESIAKDLMNEIKVLDCLKSAGNVVHIEDFDVREQADFIGWEIYIRMELLENLDAYRSRHTMTVKDVVHLGIDLCRALEYCEKSRIVHRDIKPKNIFVDRYGTYKLGDFGIARQMEKTQSTMSQKGTELYMAPEVRFGMSGTSFNVDIYSLGLVMYRLLNKNRMPFEPVEQEMLTYRDREQAIERRLRGERLPDPADADRVLSDLIRRACEYDKERRYAHAGDMRRDLVNYLSGETSEAQETPLREENVREEAACDEEETVHIFSHEKEKEAQGSTYHYSFRKDGRRKESRQNQKKENKEEEKETQDSTYHYSFRKDGGRKESRQKQQKENKEEKKNSYRRSWHKPEDVVKPLYLFRTEALIGLTREITERGKCIQLRIPKGMQEGKYIRISLPEMQKGNLYYSVQFVPEKAKGDLSDFEAKILTSLDLNPGDLDQWMELGQLRQQRRLYEDAKNCFVSTLEVRADYLPALTALGDLFSEQEDYQNASRWYERAVRGVNAGTVDLPASQCEKLYITYAISKEKCGKDHEARKILEEAVKKNFMLKKDADKIGAQLGLEKKSKGFFSRWKK